MTEQWTVWAIRHIPTGAYIPSVRSTQGRGGSYLEPMPGAFPRLFQTKHAARMALVAWLKGHHVRHGYVDFESGHIVESGIKIQHQPHRKAEKMELVRLCLTT